MLWRDHSRCGWKPAGEIKFVTLGNKSTISAEARNRDAVITERSVENTDVYWRGLPLCPHKTDRCLRKFYQQKPCQLGLTGTQMGQNEIPREECHLR